MKQEYLIVRDGKFMTKYRLTYDKAIELLFQDIKDHPELINQYMISVEGGETGYTPLLDATHIFEYHLFKSMSRFKGMEVRDTLMYQVAHYLLDQGADVNMVQSRGQSTGQTTLHYLARSDSLFDYDLAKKVLDLGGDLNIQDHALKCTPMHYASINNAGSGYDALKLYLQYPYDINIKNCGGFTCYDLAVAAGSDIYYPEEVQKEMDAKRLAEGKSVGKKSYFTSSSGQEQDRDKINLENREYLGFYTSYMGWQDSLSLGLSKEEAQCLITESEERFSEMEKALVIHIDPSSAQKRNCDRVHVENKEYEKLHDSYMSSIDSIPTGLNKKDMQELVDQSEAWFLKEYNDPKNYTYDMIPIMKNISDNRENETMSSYNLYEGAPIHSNESNGSKARAALNEENDRAKNERAKKRREKKDHTKNDRARKRQEKKKAKDK